MMLYEVHRGAAVPVDAIGHGDWHFVPDAAADGIEADDLAWIQNTCDRVAPWVSVVVGDGYLRVPSDPKNGGWLYGVASFIDDRAAVALRGHWGDTLHHELWHCIERCLHEDDIAAVTDACDLVPSAEAVVPRVGSGYKDADRERSARLYAAYAVARDNGAPRGWRHHERIFEHVYSGRMRKEFIRTGALQGPALLSARKARRAACRWILAAAANEITWAPAAAVAIGLLTVVLRHAP